MTPVRARILLVAAVVLLQSPAWAAEAYTPQPLTPPVPVNLGIAAVATGTGLFVALDAGYFNQEGLDIVSEPLNGNSSDSLALLATGQIDFTEIGPDASWFNSIKRGIGVKAVAAATVASSTDASSQLIVRSDWIASGRYMTLADLKGANIGIVGPASTSQWLALRALEQGHLTANDVRFTVLPFPDFVPAMHNHALDAAWAVEPIGTLAEDNGFAKPVARIGQLAPGFPFVMLASPKTKPEVAEHFVLALLRGERDVYNALQLGTGDKNAVYLSLARHTATKDPQKWAHYHLGSVNPNGEFDPKVLEPLEEFFIAAGSMKAKVDLSQTLDRDALNWALAKLGRIPVADVNP